MCQKKIIVTITLNYAQIKEIILGENVCQKDYKIHRCHSMLAFLSSLPVSVLRILDIEAKKSTRVLISYMKKKGKRKVQGVQQSQTAALPRPQEEEETDKSKQAQIKQTYEKHYD